MPVYRIRRRSGSKGGSNYYHHADVIAPNWWTALRAAKQGRVANWRWIDRFDTAPEDYERFEHLYSVDAHRAMKPRRPLTHREYREFRRESLRLRRLKQRRIAKSATSHR